MNIIFMVPLTPGGGFKFRKKHFYILLFILSITSIILGAYFCRPGRWKIFFIGMIVVGFITLILDFILIIRDCLKKEEEK